MLISSPRHRPSDLRIWFDLAESDLLINTEGRSRAAIEVICSFIKNGLCYAGISWGKDSVVLAHLLWRAARHVPLVHLCPTNHNPDCDEVRDTYFSHFEGQPYEEVAVDYSGIDRVVCTRAEVNIETDRRWYAAIRTIESRYGWRHLLGIRAEESTGRLIRMNRWGLTSTRACAPMGRWRVAEIFAYLAEHDLPIHPAYACLGGGRWKREKIRVAEIGDTHGTGMGRAEWEREYYGAELRRVEFASQKIIRRNT